MKKFKLGKYKVIVYALAVLLIGAGVLLTSVNVAQGAEENRIVAEQSENTGLAPAFAASTEPAIETPGPAVTAAATPGPECITEDEAKEAFTWVATEIFGMKVDKNKLTVQFNGTNEYNTHESWSVTGPDAGCSVDAVSGDVLTFYLTGDKKYSGKSITLEEFDDPAFSSGIYEDPDNAYAKSAAEIVNLKLANGRVIDEVMIDGIQFVWDNNGEGFDPEAKGTIQVDAKVLMPTGRSYCLNFLGTKQLELVGFSSHPTKDACLWGYFYEEEAGDYPPSPVPSGWQSAPGITAVPSAVPGN